MNRVKYSKIADKKKDKRKSILSAAIQEFAKKGFSGANINEISAIAGVACGTIYLYFKNKEDLLINCMREMMEENLKKIRKHIAPFPRAVERLTQFFYYHVELFTANPTWARFLVVELRQSEEFYKKYPAYNPYQEYLFFIQDLIKQSIAEETTRPYNPVTLSYLVLGFMDMTLTQWVINPEAVDLKSIAIEAQKILHYGLATDSFR